MHTIRLPDIGHWWLNGVLHDGRRYAMFAIAVWLVLWVVLARVISARKIREESPPPRQLFFELFFSLRSIALYSTVGIGINLAQEAGLYPLSDAAVHWGWPWFALALGAMIVAQDGYVYAVASLAMITGQRWFRTFHRRHHKSNNPSPFTAYSFDLGEAFLMVAFVAVWPAMFPTPWGVIDIFMFHQIFRNTLLHAGYELTPARADGRPWFGWLTTTTHHDLQPRPGRLQLRRPGSHLVGPLALGTEHPDHHVAIYARSALRSRVAAAETVAAPAVHSTPRRIPGRA